MMYILKHGLKTIMIGLMVGILLELFVFNFSFFRKLPVMGVQENISIAAEEMEFINWVQEGSVYISGLDPIIAIFAVDRRIEDFELVLDISEETIPLSVFYTSEEGEVFCAEKMITQSASNGKNTIDMGMYVHDLRIDLGEMDHLTLQSIDLVLAGNQLQFSVSRVILVLVIMIMEKLLFSLQRSPDYERYCEEMRK